MTSSLVRLFTSRSICLCNSSRVFDPVLDADYFDSFPSKRLSNARRAAAERNLLALLFVRVARFSSSLSRSLPVAVPFDLFLSSSFSFLLLRILLSSSPLVVVVLLFLLLLAAVSSTRTSSFSRYPRPPPPPLAPRRFKRSPSRIPTTKTGLSPQKKSCR